MSDRADLKQAILNDLPHLWQPGNVREVRILSAAGRSNRTDSGYFDDPEKLAAALASGPYLASNCYLTINPVDPVLLARSCNRFPAYAKQTTSDKDVLARRFLPMDFDAQRPAGVSSTDAEHEAALQAARDVRDWLRGKGWPEPIYADSGNGAHLLYAVDLPNDDTSKALIQQCLGAVAAWLSAPGVVFDTSVFNAARIWKLYGTTARKGDDMPERPHRQSKVLEAGDAAYDPSR